jgi:predicted transposase YdaD
VSAGILLASLSTGYTTLRSPSYDLVPHNRPFKRAERLSNAGGHVTLRRYYAIILRDSDPERLARMRDEGLEQGFEQGRHAALLETARKMLARGMPVEEIVAVTELPRKEVEKPAGETRSQEGRDTEDE